MNSSGALIRRYIQSLIITTFGVGGLFLSGCAIMSQSIGVVAVESGKNECVILLHGLGRTSNSMGRMQKALARAGFHTVNFDYPSRKNSVEQLATNHIPDAIARCHDLHPERIHFVTHSLGGIVARMALKLERPDNFGRIVMLSPPNRGSEAADVLQNRWLYSWINGLAGQELSTSSDSIPNQLGPVDYPVGIIMGEDQTFFDTWVASLYSGAEGEPVFSGPNDGKISIERAKLRGMTDFIVVPENHTHIMQSEYVQYQTIEFLTHGNFSQDHAGVWADQQ